MSPSPASGRSLRKPKDEPRLEPFSLREAIRAVPEVLKTAGPVLRRELVGLLRQPRFLWAAVLIVLATGLIPLLHWPEAGTPMPHPVAARAFRTYCVIFAMAIFLFVPAMAGGAVAGERERGTYELLLSSTSRPAGIVLGKLGAVIASFALLLALTFPAAAVIYLLGGVAFVEFLLVIASFFIFALLLAVFGLHNSMACRSTLIATLITYGIFALFSVLLPWSGVLFQFTPFRMLSLGTLLMFVLIAPLPLFLMFRKAHFLDPIDFFAGGQNLPGLRHQSFRLPAGRPSFPTRRLLARAAGGIPDGWNPLFLSAMRNEAWGEAADYIIPLLGGFFYLMLMALFVPGAQDPFLWMNIAGCILVLAALALALPALAAGSLAGEREATRLDALRGSLLGAGEILRGKLAAVWLTGLRFLVLGGFLILALLPFLLLKTGSGAWTIPLLFAPVLASVFLAASTAGLLAAVIARTEFQAVVLGYAILAAHQAALLFPGPLFGFIAGAIRIGHTGAPGFPAALFLAVGLSLLASAAQYRIAVRVFDRRWMRDR